MKEERGREELKRKMIKNSCPHVLRAAFHMLRAVFHVLLAVCTCSGATFCHVPSTSTVTMTVTAPTIGDEEGLYREWLEIPVRGRESESDPSDSQVFTEEKLVVVFLFPLLPSSSLTAPCPPCPNLVIPMHTAPSARLYRVSLLSSLSLFLSLFLSFSLSDFLVVLC